MDVRSTQSSVKRLLQELKELKKQDTDEFLAYPLSNNIFQWHFTLRGPLESPYEEGFYHGKLIFPPNYPFEPPDIFFLSESGRFQLNMKICISITSYHPENWSPTFTIPIILRALRAYMQYPGYGSVGSLDYPEKTVRVLALESQGYSCQVCGENVTDHIMKLKRIAKPGSPDQKSPSKENRNSSDKNCPRSNICKNEAEYVTSIDTPSSSIDINTQSLKQSLGRENVCHRKSKIDAFMTCGMRFLAMLLLFRVFVLIKNAFHLSY